MVLVFKELTNMKYINPAKLQIGDIILTTSMSILGTVIRRRTWPKKGWFDMNCATHTAIVCDRGGGLFYACEMTGAGLEMTELQHYDNKPGSWFDHIVAVRRHPLLAGPGDNPLDKRMKANQFMIETHSFHVHYGYDKLLEYLFPKSKDDPYTMICSQWARRVFVDIGITPPFPDLCSPADWQNWTDLADVQFS
jgi:hypothetical protein